MAVAETTEAARRLLLPEAFSLARSRTRGAFPPLVPVEEIEALEPHMTEKEHAYYTSALRGQLHGTEAEVAVALDAAIERSGADEVLVTTSTYDREALRDSYRTVSYTHL